ncbi:winged helix-turn-helix domain-containing protein [Halovivax limisalsi]|uniref:winged helix-turn-helix domain-containing protein n=1 Tax=Halovivax limisalsi TaxID=1453760 RepID=UPI001FFD2D18|nr:winged helix-turn-helix domain-containing protein [Halovivax limisalsi]
MAADSWDDVNERTKAVWKADTTPFERVYAIVEGTHGGQPAARIAERALVSEPTARQHCKTLVNTGFAETESDGQTTLYKRNSDRVLDARIRELRNEATRDEILDGIERMKREIREYQDRYDVVTPEALARELEADEGGWDDLSAWRTTRTNLAVAQAALAYDEASHQLTA